MEKVVKFLAALTAITLALAFTACDSSDANTDSGNNTSSNLPASVGTNPFKGKTFEYFDKYSDSNYWYYKYTFSDDGNMITYYEYDSHDDEEREHKYKCSVNAKEHTLSWQYENYKEIMEEFEKAIPESLEHFEERWREEGSSDEKIAEKLKEWEEMMRKSAYLQYAKVYTFSYTYDSAKGTLDLVEVFDEQYTSFYYEKDGSNYSNFTISWAGVNMYYNSANIELSEYRTSLQFTSKSFDKDKKEIVFVNEDDEADTFTATYRLIGSGNNTKLILSFRYNERKFTQELDLSVREINLTEAK